jgi:hypothetical protein
MITPGLIFMKQVLLVITSPPTPTTQVYAQVTTGVFGDPATLLLTTGLSEYINTVTYKYN